MFGTYQERELGEALNAAHRGLLQILEIYENDVVFFRDLHLQIKMFYGASSASSIETCEVEMSGSYTGRVGGAKTFSAIVMVQRLVETGGAKYPWRPAGRGSFHKKHSTGAELDIHWHWFAPGKMISPVRVSPAFEAPVATGCHLGDRTTGEWLGSVVHGIYAPTNYVPGEAA